MLARWLVLWFSLLAILESVFLGMLCYDILEAERVAVKQFQIASATQDLSKAMQAARKLWQLRGDVYMGILPIEEYRKSFARFSALEATAAKSMKENGIDSDSIERLQQKVAEFDRMSERGLEHAPSTTGSDASKIPDKGSSKVPNTNARKIVDSGSSKLLKPENTDAEEIAKANAEYTAVGWQASRMLVKEMRHMHEILSRKRAAHLALGIDPLLLIYTGAATTLVVLSLIVLFVSRSITRPISKLVDDCDRIRLKTALEKPPAGKSEMSKLQQSFYAMSLTVERDNKRRRSYLEFLQELQSAKLSEVDTRLGILSNTESLPQKARTRLSNARHNIASLLTLLKSMTDALNSDSGQRYKLQRSRCSINQLLRQVHLSVEALAQQRNITLSINSADYFLSADPALLSRVLQNLVSNAIKYSPAAETVTITVSQEKHSLKIVVKDNGPGIPESEQDRLFRRFSQVSAADGIKRSGTGLGLVICKDIVEAHGGSIGCESEANKGSSFWFTLPLRAVQEAKHEEKLAPLQKLHVTPFRSGRIEWQFGTLLLSFLAIQVFVFCGLHNCFSESRHRAKTFTEERNTLKDTQELFALGLLWGKQTQVAAEARDFRQAAKTLPLLKELKSKTATLLTRLKNDHDVSAYLARMLTEEQQLLSLANHTFSNLDSISAEAMDRIINEAMRRYTLIDLELARLMMVQEARFLTSYDWSQQLRVEIMTLLICTAVIDLIIISVAVLKGLQIANRIMQLKKKTDEFAQGSLPKPSFKGNDDLTLLDQRLCEVTEEIRESESQRQELIAVINHDLRTPLSSVLNGLQIINEGVLGDIQENDEALIEVSEQDLQHLLRQITDLLTIEKIDSGAFQLKPEKLNLEELFAESEKTSEQTRKQKRLRLAYSPDRDLISKTELNGDRELLQRLYSIILDNAALASPISSKLTLSVSAIEDRIIAEIEDQGKGIDPQLLHCLFERFRFLNDQPIPGLGLPLAQRICQLHKGHISIKASNRNGTTVIVDLPCKETSFN